MTFVEKFLFDKFKGMPLWVRVLTYLVVLLVFVYLLLVPRFINGQLVFLTQNGGFVPYRGTELQMQVDGRDYKFKSNEGGYWSIPIVSKLPAALELQIYHQDLAQWYPVKFTAARIWSADSHRVEIANGPPYVKLTEIALGDDRPDRLIAGLEQWLSAWIGNARAFLIVAKTVGAPIPASEAKTAEKEVSAIVGKVIGKGADEITSSYRLTGTSAPTYVQKIQIVTQIEKAFGFTVPDEHWKNMSSVGSLVDYVHKRQILNRANPGIVREPNMSWPSIQRSFPADVRPVFRPE